MRTKTTRATETEADIVHPSHLEGSTLPPDWEWVSLGNICRTTSGGTPSRKNKEYFEGDIPWVKSGELPDGLVSEVEECITREAVKNSSAKQFPKGTLLIALYGATVGKLGVLSKEAATNQAVCAIFPPDCLETKYLFWYLRFVRSDLIAQAIGGAQPNISQGILRNLLIPVAPPYEQKRIAAEIEKQFSRLDEAVANLKRIKAHLRRYKAGVLKAAVEGKLTEEWRKAHPTVEQGSKLLERTLARRLAKWNGKGKYKDPVKTNTVKPLMLPVEWEWTSLDSLTAQIGDVDHKMPKAIDGGIPYISTKDFTGDNQIDFDKAKTISITDYERLARKIKPEPGDILLSRYGTVGETRVVPTKPIFQASYSIAILKPLIPFVNTKYLLVVLRSQQLRSEMIENVRASSQPDLGLEYIRKLSIPLPSLGEQELIVAEVERRLSVIEELEVAAEANLTRADRLRQSVLARAFSGQLTTLQ